MTIDKGTYPEIATDALGRLVKDAPALKDMEVAAQLELRRSALKVMGYLTRDRPQPRGCSLGGRAGRWKRSTCARSWSRWSEAPSTQS